MSFRAREDAVAKYVREQMPERIRMLRRCAMHDLQSGPGANEGEADWPGYWPALKELRAWIDSEMPSTLYVDEDDCVEEILPKDSEDWAADHFHQFDRAQITRAVFGSLVKEGGF